MSGNSNGGRFSRFATVRITDLPDPSGGTGSNVPSRTGAQRAPVVPVTPASVAQSRDLEGSARRAGEAAAVVAAERQGVQGTVPVSVDPAGGPMGTVPVSFDPKGQPMGTIPVGFDPSGTRPGKVPTKLDESTSKRARRWLSEWDKFALTVSLASPLFIPNDGCGASLGHQGPHAGMAGLYLLFIFAMWAVGRACGMHRLKRW